MHKQLTTLIDAAIRLGHKQALAEWRMYIAEKYNGAPDCTLHWFDMVSYEYLSDDEMVQLMHRTSACTYADRFSVADTFDYRTHNIVEYGYCPTCVDKYVQQRGEPYG